MHMNASTAHAKPDRQVGSPESPRSLDAPILSHGTNQARRGSRKRPDTPPSALANVSRTELTDGWVRPETYAPHWDPPQAPFFLRKRGFSSGKARIAKAPRPAGVWRRPVGGYAATTWRAATQLRLSCLWRWSDLCTAVPPLSARL